MSAPDQTVDVVIPVHNAAELTRRCIESLLAHAGARLGRVQVQDDASDAPTARMLDSLVDPRLAVHHESRNTGFGEAVNRAFARTSSRYVLVLNSDVEVLDDFVSPLAHALDADERLAAVSPSGNELQGYDLDRYLRRAGCVESHSLWAYAFLVRRRAFEEVGGFDRAYGRGFFEDVDISRRLVDKGWWLAVHPDARVRHERHGSFAGVDEYREVFGRNRDLYFGRYPEARRQVLQVTGDVSLQALPAELRRELDLALRRGGAVWWLHRGAPPRLPALPLRSARFGLLRALGMIARRRRKGRREFTDLWILEGAPRFGAALLARSARRAGVAVRRFPAAGAHST
jgi:GT2 family glycosyltransferase